MDCDHISKVISWKIKRIEGDVIEVPAMYGCTKCDAQSETVLAGS